MDSLTTKTRNINLIGSDGHRLNITAGFYTADPSHESSYLSRYYISGLPDEQVEHVLKEFPEVADILAVNMCSETGYPLSFNDLMATLIASSKGDISRDEWGKRYIEFLEDITSKSLTEQFIESALQDTSWHSTAHAQHEDIKSLLVEFLKTNANDDIVAKRVEAASEFLSKPDLVAKNYVDYKEDITTFSGFAVLNDIAFEAHKQDCPDKPKWVCRLTYDGRTIDYEYGDEYCENPPRIEEILSILQNHVELSRLTFKDFCECLDVDTSSWHSRVLHQFDIERASEVAAFLGDKLDVFMEETSMKGQPILSDRVKNELSRIELKMSLFRHSNVL